MPASHRVVLRPAQQDKKVVELVTLFGMGSGPHKTVSGQVRVGLKMGFDTGLVLCEHL